MDKLFPAKPLGWWQRDREGMRTPVHRFNNDMVFVDGRLLQSAGWEGEVDENSYYIDYDKGQVYIGVDPDRAADRNHGVRQRARSIQKAGRGGGGRCRRVDACPRGMLLVGQ